MDGQEMVKQIEIRLAQIGMKKGDLYRLTDISSASYSQWKTGKNQPSAGAVEKINAVLGTHFELSNKTDYLYDKIQMLQNLRDADRYLLDVAVTMSEDQVRMVADFMKAMKQDAD